MFSSQPLHLSVLELPLLPLWASGTHAHKHTCKRNNYLYKIFLFKLQRKLRLSLAMYQEPVAKEGRGNEEDTSACGVVCLCGVCDEVTALSSCVFTLANKGQPNAHCRCLHTALKYPIQRELLLSPERNQ